MLAIFTRLFIAFALGLILGFLWLGAQGCAQPKRVPCSVRCPDAAAADFEKCLMRCVMRGPQRTSEGIRADA